MEASLSFVMEDWLRTTANERDAAGMQFLSKCDRGYGRSR